MKVQALSVAVVAALAAGTIATPSFAQDYRYRDGYYDTCRDRGDSGAVAGAAIGGVAGAVIGSNVSAHGARSEGGVIGALAGGLLGAAIGHSAASDNCRDVRYGYGYDDGYRYGGNYGYGYGYDDGYRYGGSYGYAPYAYRGGYAPYAYRGGYAYGGYSPQRRHHHDGWRHDGRYDGYGRGGW